MGVRIERLLGPSGALRAGDEIAAIDGRPAADQLDVIFAAAGGRPARFTLRRGGRTLSRTISGAAFERARPVFEPMRFIRCRSRCVFCFMDQMPRGMRPALYEKDDDYRLSFLFGNFITLNDVTDRDLARIARLRLSPLYLSVHATDGRTRERIFGRPLRRSVLDDMRYLAARGVVMHAQVVLVPGINDGAVLRRTLDDLFALYPACRSVAIVPVGLTAHRRGLAPLRPVDARTARAVVALGERLRTRFARRTGGERFLHLADELYLAAGRALPPAGTYDGYPQLANGVGMCRLFLEDLAADARRLRGTVPRRARIAIATGRLGARFLRRYALPLLERELPGFSPAILPVENRLLGRRVTVSGLLSGADVLAAARRARLRAGCLVLPPNAVNHEGRMLDDARPADLARSLGIPVRVARGTFLDRRIVRACAGGTTR